MLQPESSINQVNLLVERLPVGTSPCIFFITGASGSGKTFLTKKLEEHLSSTKVHVAYSDKVGVPSSEEMIEQYVSGERWQEATTHEWVRRLSQMTDKALIVFEGQHNPSFAIEGCRAVSQYYTK